MKLLKSDILHTQTLLQIHPNISFPHRTIRVSNSYSLRPLYRSMPLRCRQNPNFQVVRGSMEEGRFLEVEEAELLMETCITRTLPPALTLQHGLGKIMEAVEELKLNPPCSVSGMYRFQVAVPPSAKALNWFCCQPESSGVFPQFFLSKEKEIPSYRSLYLNGTRGVFGIGASVYFQGSPSRALVELSSSKRYLSVDLSLVMAYGFMDINFDTKSSSMKHETGSYFLFIPQIELDEFEDISILAATLAWNDSSLCTFESAVESYQLSLSQVRHNFWNNTEKCHNKCIRSALRKFNLVEDKKSQMVCINAFSLGGRDLETDSLKLVLPYPERGFSFLSVLCQAFT